MRGFYERISEQSALQVVSAWASEHRSSDASRIRMGGLPQIWAVARNLVLNLYREQGYKNMAQAQRFAGAILNTLKALFRLK